MCRASEIPLERIAGVIQELASWVAQQPADQLGPSIIGIRQTIDMLEAVGGEATRRFEKAGGYRADGSLGMVPWLRTHGKLAAGAAAEHVETARQLDKLPKTEEALARGEIGYQHAVAMARTAEHVGAAQVRKAETMLLKAGVRPRPGGLRPTIELEPTDHPLAVEQREGITAERLIEIVQRLLHADE